MGPDRIKRYLKSKYAVKIDVEGKGRFVVTRKAQTITYA